MPRVRIRHTLMVLAATGCCFWVIGLSARVALSKIFITYAAKMGNLAAANESVRLAPSDAESHFVRAEVLKFSGAANDALAELERAVALRPRDYYLWLELGLTRDELDDHAGALVAFNKAVDLAPYYAQPRWQRGNLLLRNGQFNEAFADLRRAAGSNPDLLPNVMDLAWGVSRQDAKLTEQLAGISSERGRLMFAQFLASRGNASDALAQFRTVKDVSQEARHKLVEQLIADWSFEEAFAVWSDSEAGTRVQALTVQDGSFEGSLGFGAAGFSWDISRSIPAVKMALDASHPHSGLKSLQVEFRGEPPADRLMLSQLILVEPSGKYRLNFAARTQELVTGSLPLMVINDARDKSMRLGASAPLGQGTRDWQVFTFEFTAGPETRAVVLSLRREICQTQPCPIFGSVWLDSFSIQLVQ
ncbi:MAG TPA: tetratricopeptide repeat protein [Pyrinomonadaceae bacterium]|nr:tetratricopeptide repeat protein [Pyrinomonadaceae bacterium]